MKIMIATALLLGTGALTTLTAQDAQPEAAPAPIQITDTEAVVIDKTIRGYAEMRNQKLELFDRKKGKTVSLRLDRIVTDDPACLVFPKEGYVALCGECTEVEGTDKEPVAGDKYVLWFVLKRGNLVNCTVENMHVKSVNGNPMYEFTKGADGTWSATVVPDPAEPTAPPAE